MKLYTSFRWCPFLYQWIYSFYEGYHERKIVYQITAKVVKWWDKSLLFAPILYILYQYFPNQDLINALVELPVLKTFHQYYQYNAELFSILAILLFLCAEIFANNLRSIENEKIVSTCFHFVNHQYRNFVDKLLIFKREKQIYSDTLMNGQAEIIKDRYATIIYEMCRRAQRAMAKIINDPECYISIKWLESVNGAGKGFVLNHDKSFPFDEPQNHVTQLRLLRSPNGTSKTLFQSIMGKFANPDADAANTWDFGIMSNDVKGNQSFDTKLPGFDKRVKATIVLPITIDSSLKGFFCFNSTKVGRLRKKHQHFLSGYCDNIANLYRSLVE
jgi:hypothetical protein